MVAIIERISPQEAKEHLNAGALLIAAYDSEAEFRQNRLEGAISLDQLQGREETTAEDRELIFYCA